jgi:hypothetical protein
LLLGQLRIRVSALGKDDFDLGPAGLPCFMELVAKTFNGVVKTSFEEVSDLLLEKFVLLSCTKPRFSHDDVRDDDDREWQAGIRAVTKEITPETERMSDNGVKFPLRFIPVSCIEKNQIKSKKINPKGVFQTTKNMDGRKKAL